MPEVEASPAVEPRLGRAGGYLPIGDHAATGDGRTVALLANPS